jgi:phosphatidylserine/phosphatidylglycerophosphate/cardiolipin synthase-like enzyme
MQNDPNLAATNDPELDEITGHEVRSYVGKAVIEAIAAADKGTVELADTFAMGHIGEIWLNKADGVSYCVSRITDLVRAAQHEICIQSYIIDHSSRAFQELFGAILEKQTALPDFKVRIISTAVEPSYTLPQVLTKLGIRAQIGQFKLTRISRASDHEKSYIIDGTKAVVGGDNLDNDAEHDMVVELQGPIVAKLLKDFDSAWQTSWKWFSTDPTVRVDGTLPEHPIGPAPQLAGPLLPLVILSKPYSHVLEKHYDNNADRAFEAAFDAARYEIKVESPAVNDVHAIDALKRALMRNVKIKVLMPKNYEHWATWLDRISSDQFLKLFVDLPRENRALMELRWYAEDGRTHRDNHTKYYSVDGLWMYFGSQNMDNQSWAYSREMGIGVDDQAATRRFDEAVFDRDWATSIPEVVAPEDLERQEREHPAIGPLQKVRDAMSRD